MRKFTSPLVIVSLLIVSCSVDTIEDSESITSKISGNKFKKPIWSLRNVTPENPANRYDFIGEIHNEILGIYLSSNYGYNTIAQITQQIEAIAVANNDFNFLDIGVNLVSDSEIIMKIINNPQTELNFAIENSIMTSGAKQSLSNFINDTYLLDNSNYVTIYQAIVSYELSVINQSGFSNEDKRIILTTSSIIRHSLYYAKERKDEDWNTSVGHRVGGLSGSINNSTTAIIRALVAGVMINNLIVE